MNFHIESWEQSSFGGSIFYQSLVHFLIKACADRGLCHNALKFIKWQHQFHIAVFCMSRFSACLLVKVNVIIQADEVLHKLIVLVARGL